MGVAFALLKAVEGLLPEGDTLWLPLEQVTPSGQSPHWLTAKPGPHSGWEGG